MLKTRMFLTAVLSMLLLGMVQAADERIKPFFLAGVQSGDMASVVDATKQKLTAAGFGVVGEYSPYAGVTIIGVTNGDLIQAAGETEFGVFGVAQRVTVSKGTDGKMQVAYTNPTYMAHAYRMKGDLADVTAALNKALGMQKPYGSKKGKTAEKLRDYQYKWLMPYFYDRLELASYSSYDAAVTGVEAALAAGKGGVKKVYRVDLPGKEASLFGVDITDQAKDECAGDKYIMERIDFRDIKSTGHLPYDIVVKGKKAYALPAEFRIAISFPDLSMMGKNSFASIMCAPSAIEETLTLGAGGSASE
jgi:hypothetical protein